MSLNSVVRSSQTVTPHPGWTWLLLTTASRGYLAFLGTLTAFVVLPMLMGLSGSTIMSGSMMPHIKPGDVVMSRALPADAPPPLGLVITFQAPPGSAKSGLIMHRVVGANENGSLVTAGDANANADSTPLDQHNIIGQARWLIPLIGLPYLWASNRAFLPLGLWVLLTATALLVEATVLASRRPPSNPGRGGAQVPGTDMPGFDLPGQTPQGVRPHSGAATSLLNRARLVIAPAGVTLAVLLTAGAIITAPLGQAAAVFTGRTSSAGSRWAAAGPATKLAFTKSPSSSTRRNNFATQPVVAVQDGGGGTVDLSAVPVTLTITGEPPGAKLTCAANPINAVKGVATFAGCGISKAGKYTLTATSGALTVISLSFNIT